MLYRVVIPSRNSGQAELVVDIGRLRKDESGNIYLHMPSNPERGYSSDTFLPVLEISKIELAAVTEADLAD